MSRGEDLQSQQVLQLALDGVFERTSAKMQTVDHLDEGFAGGFAHF